MTIGTNEVGFPGGAYVNAIDAYSGNTLTLSADTTAITGDLRLNGNAIQNSLGNDVLTTNNTDQNAVFTGDLTIDGANLELGDTAVSSNTQFDILANDSYYSQIRVMGTSTGGGQVYVGESSSYGGGIDFNGDSSPLTTGAGNSYLNLYRRNNNSESWTMRNLFSSDDWEFKGNIQISGRQIKDHNGFTRIEMANTGSAISFVGSILPSVDDNYDLGSGSFRWDDVYATNSSIISTSDARMKSEITDCDFGLKFINKLRPVSFKWIGKKRKHYGLIAQELKTTLEEEGATFDGNKTDDFAGLVYGEEEDRFGLRYTELIAPLIKALQELALKHEELRKNHEELKTRFETDIKQEQDRNTELEKRLQSIEIAIVSITSKLS